MANHAVAFTVHYDGQYRSVPAYVRGGIALTRGAPGEGQDSPPSTATVTIDNRTRAYSPTNVNGPLYGLAGRNTPAQVSADGSVRSTTEIASWAPDQSLDGRDAWVAIQGGGVLRRLQQGKTPLLAPLHRAIVAAAPAAFWPMTDGSNATQFSSGLPGGDPVPVVGSIELAAVAGPAGVGASLPNFVGGGIGAVGLPVLTPSEWGMECVLYLNPEDASLDAGASILEWSVSGDIGRDGWSVGFSYDSAPGGDGLGISVLGDAGPTTPGFGVGAFNLTPGFHHIRLQAEQVGGSAELTLYVDGVVDPTFGTDSAVGTLGAPAGDLTIELEFGLSGNVAVGSVGMVAFYSGAVPDHSTAATGYAGELAAVRFARVLGEEGVNAVVVGDPDDTQPMGPQPLDTLVNIVRECVRTDAGLMYEPREERGLGMRTGRSLYNQDQALVLDFTGKQLAPGFKPVIDDKPTRNDVVAARRNGGTARAIQLTGPMNVQDPLDDPQGVGRVDHQHDVNTSTDDVLLGHATWQLHKGTIDEPRYPTITVDLDAAPQLIPAVNAIEIGDPLGVEHVPADWQPGGLVSQIVLGIRETFPAGAGDFRRLVAFVCMPASAYEVGIVGAADGSVDLRGQAVDTDNSTLQAGINQTATTLTVVSTGGTVWTTDPDDWNPALHGTCEWGGGLFIVVGGEVMRVTNITGASSPQTFTVVRSVNSVLKAHSSGSPVHVRYPTRVGL